MSGRGRTEAPSIILPLPAADKLVMSLAFPEGTLTAGEEAGQATS